MSVVLSIALGTVFLVAGVSKVAAGSVWRAQARVLGAPAVAAVVLPWIEIALGAMAVAQLGRRWVAVVSAVLLIAFTVAIARQMRRGARPPCACFGSWSSRPIGAAHVVRNAALIALAVAVAALS